MRSEWLPWDFMRNHTNVVEINKYGLYNINFFDPYIEKLILNKLYGYENHNGQWISYRGKEITIDWIEKVMLSNDLFGASSHIIIYQAENIPENSKSLLMKNSSIINNRYVVLSSVDKRKSWYKLGNNEEIINYNITEPKFWEKSKLIDFLLENISLSINFRVKDYLLQSLPLEVKDIVNAINLIKINNINNSSSSLNEIRKLLGPSFINNFEMAGIYSNKNQQKFYRVLLDSFNKTGFQELEELFRFMQGHLFRMLDTSYIDKKNRPSKYDKEIILYTKMWSSKEIKKSMRAFGQMQILAKKKSKLLLDYLRCEYLSDHR